MIPEILRTAALQKKKHFFIYVRVCVGVREREREKPHDLYTITVQVI